MRNMLVGIILIVFFVVAAYLIFWKFWFLRDPERVVPEGPNIVSPADGKVIKIMEIDREVEIEKGLLGRIRTKSEDVKKAKYLVSIFMTPLDVHVQRAPFNGRIAATKHEKGRFMSANSINAFYNENNEILIEDVDCLKVIQIAGFLARRIECFVKPGDHVVKGDRIGRINLGSQVSLILPENVNILVQEGEMVRAGETIIADLL